MLLERSHSSDYSQDSTREDRLWRPYLNQVVVIDMASPYVCLGTLVNVDAAFVELIDADLHDLRDSQTTREVYVYDSKRYGIRRNRSKVLIRRDEAIAIALLDEILES